MVWWATRELFELAVAVKSSDENEKVEKGESDVWGDVCVCIVQGCDPAKGIKGLIRRPALGR